MKKKETKQIILTIVTLILTVVLVSGGTFAYFVWESGLGDNTLINVTVSEGITMLIEPSPATKTGMYPTSNCGGEAGMVGYATVTIINDTGTLARPRFRLKAKVEPEAGKTLKVAHLAYINYAVFEGTGRSCELSQAVATGTLTGGSADDWGHYPRSSYLRTGDSGTNWVTFEAPAYKTTTRMYTVWAWIDHMYNPGNMGVAQTQDTDALQNATITFTWSEQSIVEQITSS